MNSRSRKYYEAKKANRDATKGSATNAGYDEQNQKTIREPKKNPAPSKKQDQGSGNATATQDDTGGENNSGKRSDDE